MIVIIIIILSIYFIWTYLMVKDKLNIIDKKIYNRLKIEEPFISFFKRYTYLGSFWFYVLVFIILLLFFNSNLVIPSIIFMGGVSLLIWIFKHIFKRIRPNIRRLVKEKGYSYPSGHMMSSVCFYGFIIFIILMGEMNIFLKIIFSMIFIIHILVIGFSRIFLGVHYFSDIVGGMFLGLAYLLVYIYMTLYILKLI